MSINGQLTVKLNNGKVILIKPNYQTNKCFFRYLTEEETYGYIFNIDQKSEKWIEVSMATEINPMYSTSINYIQVDGQLIRWNYDAHESKLTEDILKTYHLGRFVH